MLDMGYFLRFAIGAATLVCAGCAFDDFMVPAPSRPLVTAPTRLTATGHGSTGGYSQYNHTQQKQMAMRAAQVDAYRNLAEQVQGFRIWGNTTVAGFATQSDSVRTYVDAYLRGAKLVGIVAGNDGSYEATVELVLNDQFIDCISPQRQCPGIAASPIFSGCAAPECSAPSANYYSNR